MSHEGRRPPPDERANKAAREHLTGPSAHEVALALRLGTCPSELAFDRFLPTEFQDASEQHWTPLEVSLRVAEWLEWIGAKTVVDIGAGPGKFCVATALASSCRFTGIEQRQQLVDAARELAESFGVAGRVEFVQAVVSRSVIPDADAYYLYNPFGENLLDHHERLGRDVELGSARYHRDVALVEEFLERAPVGTHVVKYNGFGGTMPPTYDLVFADHRLPNTLRLWRKARSVGDSPSTREA